MEQIRNKEYGGERPLFATHDLQLEDVTIHAGESALKECSNIIAINCRFEGKYPFWHTNGFIVKNCLFTEGARAALWYSQSLQMADTLVEAPKMFREMDGIKLENVQLPNALETFWYCRNIELKNVQIDKADYLFIHSENIKIQNYAQNGNYSFQYCKNVEIRNAVINSKDAFWNTENVTVYDSELNGEYGSVVILGGLSLVNSLHAYTFASLKRKKLISTTPLNDALNALILALNASAAAFVLLFTKKFRILS